MKKVNLEIIYKKVKQRIRKASGFQKELAILATEAAKQITLKPTLTSVKIFRKVERDWLQYANKNSKSMADEFEKAIKSKNFISEPVYNSSSNGFKPAFGHLYCFASNNYPGIVKIGSTAEKKIRVRLLTYKSRHSLDHLEIVFSIQTSDPATKEEEIQSSLSSRQIYPETIPKSNEWFKISKRKAVKLIKQYG